LQKFELLKESIAIHDKFFKRFISQKEIEERVEAIGKKINADYEGQNPLFIGVLNGAFIFAADLVRATALQSEIIFVKLSSYEGLQSSGKVINVIGVTAEVVKDRPIIIIEDIVDTGRTMTDFIATLQSYQPKSIALATMFLKPDALQHDVKTDYVGFSIPDKFIVGYGLDYDGYGRNLTSIYQLAE
jgi:hypoxanthine phosphoribosyltransferase